MKRLFILVALSVLAGCATKNAAVKKDVALSYDAERIAYNAFGAGETALVFIHGWSCDSSYWNNQIPAFSGDYKVITMDLAGHGDSSAGRADFTMPAFGRDVEAVIEAEKVNRAILIGHSMGGAIVAEAARLMPNKVVAIMGIDTMQNVVETYPQAMIDGMIGPFEEDFQKGMQGFVTPMFPESADPELVQWIIDDMAAAPKDAALSSVRNYLEQYVSGTSGDAFKELKIPVVCINARMWPTNPEANKKVIKHYKLYYIEDSGHFPMLEKPEAFNALLSEALEYIDSQKN